jgi:sulfhydrogenase subunit alpha
MERIPQLVDELVNLPDEPIMAVPKKTGKAAGAVEAPRGTLYHWYDVVDGLVADGDIITPTAQSADDIERTCFESASRLLAAGKEGEIVPMMNLIVRAYDPCVSCSVHLIRLDGGKEKRRNLP